MLILVSGGASSGKSAFAEALVGARGDPKLYLATMQVWDAESEARVERHRAMRAGKGFETIERPADLAGLALPEGCAVLLEDLPNLFANEYFGAAGAAGAAERVLRGVLRAAERSALLAVVTGNVYAGGMDYAAQTRAWLAELARLERKLAAAAEQVWEVVCGIPVGWKGEAV